MSDTENPHKDVLGHKLHEANFIVYPALWSRSAVLKIGIVTSLEMRKRDRYMSGSEETPTLRVITADRTRKQDRVNAFSDYYWELQNHGRPITLSFVDRVMKQELSSIPFELCDLLYLAFAEHKKNTSK